LSDISFKHKVEKNAGNNGVTEFGEKVGGAGQPPMKVVENAVIAGYNYDPYALCVMSMPYAL
jgi:hypothetical protein